MEALSPRSTNVPPRTKVTVKRAKQEQENAHMQKTQTSKNHAPPPPPLVTEPGENGESYSTGAFLGKGGFAVCYEGKLNRNGRVFALKVVKSEMNQRKMAEKVWIYGIESLHGCREGYVLIYASVPNRTPNSFENETSKRRRIPPRIRFREEYIRRP